MTLLDRIRNEAVASVDARGGHPDEYAAEERKVRAEYVDDPGRAICSHPVREHPLGGNQFVCFTCWARLLAGVYFTTPAASR